MQTRESHKTPHLAISNTGPLNHLEKQILNKEQEIEEWFEKEWEKSPAPIYGSVDLRNSGFKIAPVDMNLFPAGFNNLNKEFLPISIDAAKKSILSHAPNTKKILIVSESHTRNLFYWDSIKAILQILTKAGFEVRVGSLLEETIEIPCKEGGAVTVEPVKRITSRVALTDFDPDFVLLNNDLSDGIPKIFTDLDQEILPPAELGWSARLKSDHFQFYQAIANEFAEKIEIDPWLIAPLFRRCNKIDFKAKSGVQCIEKNTDLLLKAIQEKYDKYNIDCKPFVIIKADSGTYGMAVMTVRDVAEVSSLNRKKRSAMSKSKGGKPVESVILQEGVYTFETFGKENAIAEPVVYLWGERVVGGFYRVHKGRGKDENLNAPGMYFEPLAFATTCDDPKVSAPPDKSQNRFYVFGVIARLSMLAAAREMNKV